jgi:hypothetical protein
MFFVSTELCRSLLGLPGCPNGHPGVYKHALVLALNGDKNSFPSQHRRFMDGPTPDPQQGTPTASPEDERTVSDAGITLRKDARLHCHGTNPHALQHDDAVYW